MCHSQNLAAQKTNQKKQTKKTLRLGLFSLESAQIALALKMCHLLQFIVISQSSFIINEPLIYTVLQ